MRPSNAVRTVWNAGAIDTSHLGFRPIQKIATIHASSRFIRGIPIKIMTGVNLVHIPYRTPFVPDLLAGQVQVAFGPTAGMLDLVRSGKLRALAVTPAKRLAALPDVPALGEFVPGYEAFGWYGLGAPRKTPTEVVNKLSDATKAALGDPKSQASFVE